MKQRLRSLLLAASMLLVGSLSAPFIAQVSAQVRAELSAQVSAQVSAQLSAQVTVRDDRGAALTLAQPPQRIVSLLPSLTETVCELGACSRLVGIDRHSNWPASVRALPKLGGLEDAQIERIVALKPDMVLLAVSAREIGRAHV